MADQGPLSNTVLGARYRLGVRLGSGGFADVYLAEHIHLKTQCAIKVLTRRLTNEEIEQFRREAQTIAALDHPHILRVRDFDLDNGFPFLVMDYAPNGTLRSRHSRGTRLPLATVVAYLKQIADALQYAHAQGIVHRDIKPENMLLGKNDEILLSDFGIAVVFDPGKTHRTVDSALTPAYAAPEQFLSHVSPLSDQYSLGVVVYEWLCGERPFTAGDMGYQHNHVPPPLLSSKVPAIQWLVEQAVLHALEKDPKKRFANVREFANALEEAAYRASRLPPREIMPPTYSGHASAVNCVAWSPDGRYIASGGDDKTVQVWEAASSVHLFTYQGHDEGIQDVQSVAWAPDGRLIVSSPLVGKVQVWKAVDGELVFSASEGMGLSSVAWSHNNKYIAFFGDRDIVSIWDVTTSTRCLTYEGHYHPSFRLHARMFAPRHGLAWSPNDMCIATTGYDETLQIWDAITGRTLLTIKYTPRYRGSVAWAPFGLHIAFVGHSDHSSAKSRTAVQVCDVVTGDALLTYQGHLEELEAVAWSPSGRHIASAGKGKTVQIWEAATGKHIFTYRGHSAAVNSVAWSSDGTRIASASDDGTVQVWQVV